MKTNVYIDGFNLYYGAVKGTPHKWLDLAALCTRLFPRNQINRIRYFTAIVIPDRPIRASQFDSRPTCGRFTRSRTSPCTLGASARGRSG